MSIYYVNIACYVTKERPEMGFSPTATVPVHVEAETPELARQRVGEALSKLIAAEDARGKAIEELNRLTSADTDPGGVAGKAPQGESDVR